MNEQSVKSLYAKLQPDPMLAGRIEQALHGQAAGERPRQLSCKTKRVVAVTLSMLLILTAGMLLSPSFRNLFSGGTLPTEDPGLSLMPLQFSDEQELVAAIQANKAHQSFNLAAIRHYYRPVYLSENAVLQSITVRGVYLAWYFSAIDPADPDDELKRKNPGRWEAMNLYTFVLDRHGEGVASLQNWLEIMPDVQPLELDGFSGFYSEYTSMTDDEADPVYRRFVVWLEDDDCLYIEMPASVPLEEVPLLCQVEKVYLP